MVFSQEMFFCGSVQALLEPRRVDTEGTEYLHVGFKSSDGYVLIVYAFMYALLNGYLLSR